MQNDEDTALLNLNNCWIKRLLNELKHTALFKKIYVEVCLAGINCFHSHRHLKSLHLEEYIENFTSSFPD